MKQHSPILNNIMTPCRLLGVWVFYEEVWPIYSFTTIVVIQGSE